MNITSNGCYGGGSAYDSHNHFTGKISVEIIKL